MALHPALMVVRYRDDADRIAEITYRLETDYDDAAPNFPAIVAKAATVETQLDILTMDHIEDYSIQVSLGGGGAEPNDAASNGIYAFIRTTIPSLAGETSYVKVPAWDTVLYEEAKNGVLDAAFNLAAATLLENLVDVETGAPMNLDYCQSRQRKVFKRGLG